MFGSYNKHRSLPAPERGMETIPTYNQTCAQKLVSTIELVRARPMYVARKIGMIRSCPKSTLQLGCPPHCRTNCRSWRSQISSPLASLRIGEPHKTNGRAKHKF